MFLGGLFGNDGSKWLHANTNGGNLKKGSDSSSLTHHRKGKLHCILCENGLESNQMAVLEM